MQIAQVFKLICYSLLRRAHMVTIHYINITYRTGQAGTYWFLSVKKKNKIVFSLPSTVPGTRYLVPGIMVQIQDIIRIIHGYEYYLIRT